MPRTAISLGVVDEAVYQTREDPLPDLFATLYEYEIADRCVGRQEDIDPCTEAMQFLRGPRYAWGYYPNPLLYGCGQGHRSCLSCGGGTKCCTRSSGIALRRRFETAAHWVADLFTDANGTARVSFHLPDNVTQWRFTARGVTADTLVGSIVVARRTSLPVSVELAVPRGFREGDHIELPVVVHNNTKEMKKIQCATQVGGGREIPRAEQTVLGYGDFAFAVPVAAKDCQPIGLLASVRSADGAVDAIRRRLVPLPRVPPAVRRWSGPLDDGAIRRECKVRAQQGSELALVVRRESGLAGAVQSALDELVQYPYGCVEQTMSRFMPAVVAGAAIQEAHGKNPAGERLPEVIRQGLERLRDFQHRDGGWGWWNNDETNDFMTAYVVEGLARCRRLKQPVYCDVLQRGAAYLLRQVEEERLRGHRPASIGNVDLRVYAVHALAECTVADDDFQKENGNRVRAAARSSAARWNSAPGWNAGSPPTMSTWCPGGTSTLDRVLLADAWRLLGDRAVALAGIEEITGQTAPRADDRQSIIAAAGVLELGAALAPRDPRWQQLARQIVSERQGRGWGDTLTTSAAVGGLSAVLAAPPVEETPVAVVLDGRKIGELSAGKCHRIECRTALVGTVEFQPIAGRCHDFYAIDVQGRFDEQPPPSDPKVIIRTRVFETDPSRRERTPDASGRLSLARGRTYELRLEVDLKQDLSHARLTFPRPCGVELVRLPPREGGVVNIDGRDDAVHFFIDHWTAGRHAIVFPVRAEVAGVVLSPPPELSPMYADNLPTTTVGPRQIVVGLK